MNLKYLKPLLGYNPRYVGFCNLGLAPSPVADGGDGLQTWRIAANISNKQWRTADKWCYFTLVEGFTTLRRKKTACYEMLVRTSELDEFFGTT
jgi:hypothetical protein